MFVVMYDLSDMPANHRTFLRQRTMYVPLPATTMSTDENNNNNSYMASELKSYLRYSIHLRYFFFSHLKQIFYKHFNSKICNK
jgi:hypothetical protein